MVNMLLNSIQAWTSNSISKPKTALNRVSYLKIVLFFTCLVPAVLPVWGLLNQQLGANPIETLIRNTGVWALRFILITLCVTPLRWLTGVNQLIRFRRMLGLFAFFYASVHMLLYLGLDQFFDWHEIMRDIIKRPFITVGFACFLALIPLAVTSTNKMIKRLGGQRWKRLHKLIYFIAVAGSIHFLMLVKADIREPVIYIIIVSCLVLIRLIYPAWQNRLLKR